MTGSRAETSEGRCERACGSIRCETYGCQEDPPVSAGTSEGRPTSETPEPASRYDVPTVLWTYTICGEVPALLRQVADDIEANDTVLIGLWSAGFSKPNELVVQVVVDPSNDPEV